MTWKFIDKDGLPPFEKEVHLLCIGDQTQTHRPKRMDRGQLSHIGKNGPVFEQWDNYFDRWSEVVGDVVAWHEYPEMPEI